MEFCPVCSDGFWEAAWAHRGGSTWVEAGVRLTPLPPGLEHCDFVICWEILRLHTAQLSGVAWSSLFIYLYFLFLFFIFKKNLFIYFWLRWVLVAVRGLSLVVVSRGYSLLRCTGFSLRWLLLLQSMGSRCTGSVVVACGLSSCGSWALECRLSSCGAWALLLRGMWDLPRPGLELVSPALAGRFLTTEPPGKPQSSLFLFR